MTGPHKNILLMRMAPENLALLEPWFERVELRKLEVIDQPGEPKRFVHFVEEGILSVLSHIDDERDVELGVIGREGMSGETLVLGDDRSPFTVHVEMPGSSLRLPADRFKEAIEQSAGLHQLLLCYVRAQYLQISSTAAANQRGSVEERVARWILMGFDRIDGDRFHVTHDALAWLVGARRSGVTTALHILEGKGLIRSHRNEIILRDVVALRKAASGTYGLAEREYARLIGVDFRRDNKSAAPHRAPEFFTTRNAPEDEG